MPEGVDTFGWISGDWEMIRSPQGSVWIRICSDLPVEQEEALNAGRDDGGAVDE